MSPMWQTIGGHLILMCILLVVGLKGLGGESEFLFRAQELNLFLPTAQFYEQLATYPGGSLSWMGAFCTQILYIPQVGILLLVLLWWATLLEMISKETTSSTALTAREAICSTLCRVMKPSASS